METAMASEKDFDAEENPTVNGQVLFNPKSGTYWRINPDNDCEIQCANHREGEWKTFQRFAAPIIKLTADDEHECASVTIKKYQTVYLHLEEK